jgi:multisubunit Na+/H+ antiporter MnhB subunit
VTTTVLTRAVARLMLAPVVMVALAILVKGYVDVGDGFAAGIVAALGVLLQYLAFGRHAVERALPVRHAPHLAAAGLLIALGVAFVPALFGDAPLQHVPPPGADVVTIGSLELITAVLFDVGVFALVVGVCVAVIGLLAAEAAEEQTP